MPDEKDSRCAHTGDSGTRTSHRRDLAILLVPTVNGPFLLLQQEQNWLRELNFAELKPESPTYTDHTHYHHERHPRGPEGVLER